MKTRANRGKGKFRIIRYENPSGATVHRVTGWTWEGKRVRENFATHGEAVTKLRELEVEAVNLADSARPVVTRLTPAQIAIAERAFADIGDKVPDAVRFYRENYRDPINPIGLGDAVAKFIAHKETMNLRPDTMRNLNGRLDLFKRQCGDNKPLSEISTDACKEFVNRPRIDRKTSEAVPVTPRSKVNARLVLSNFFKWAVENKFVMQSPLLTVKVPKTEKEAPELLTLAQVRDLLKAASGHKDGKLVPYIALGLFAGIRPKELSRLSWDAIRLDTASVNIDAKIAKRRGRRVVALSSNAVAWLQPFALARAPIVPKNFRRDFDKVRKVAGLLVDWDADQLRHTAVSMHFARDKHEGATAQWAGNSVEVVHDYYKGLVPAGDEELFWKIAPDPVKAKTKAKRRKAA